MQEKKDDILGRYDELELVELGDADAHGGTTWTTVTVPISLAICPTFKCSSKC